MELLWSLSTLGLDKAAEGLFVIHLGCTRTRSDLGKAAVADAPYVHFVHIRAIRLLIYRFSLVETPFPTRPPLYTFFKKASSLSNFFKAATGAIPIISAAPVLTPSPRHLGQYSCNREQQRRALETRGDQSIQTRQMETCRLTVSLGCLGKQGDALPRVSDNASMMK